MARTRVNGKTRKGVKGVNTLTRGKKVRNECPVGMHPLKPGMRKVEDNSIEGGPRCSAHKVCAIHSVIDDSSSILTF
jgi:hypothetical protein